MAIQDVLSVVGAVTGVIGSVFGAVGILRNRYLAVDRYLEAVEAPAFMSVKHIIYNRDITEPYSIDCNEAAQIANFFHHWGLLAKKRYLPLWVFDYGSGAGAVRLYELTRGYIMLRRQFHHDDTYASGFEWLYYKLKRRRLRKKW